MRILGIALILITVFSCKKEEVKNVPQTAGHKILISNEGNFGWGVGSLSIYHPDSKKIDNDVYNTLNNKTLGNVFQSIAFINNHYYLVINNSSKIVVCDSNFIHTTEISGLNSPRNIYQVSPTKAYVTDIYSDKLWIIDLNSNTVSGNIPLLGWLESAVLLNNQFIVGNMESDYIYSIDIDQDKISDSVRVAYANQSLCLDASNAIWILSQGNGSDKKAQLSKWIPNSDTLALSLVIDQIPSHLKYSQELSELYFLNQDIYKINVKTPSNPAIHIDLKGINAYGFGMDYSNGDLYISDVHDFVSQSTIHRYSKTAQKLDEFKAGIISGNFY